MNENKKKFVRKLKPTYKSKTVLTTQIKNNENTFPNDQQLKNQRNKIWFFLLVQDSRQTLTNKLNKKKKKLVCDKNYY